MNTSPSRTVAVTRTGTPSTMPRRDTSRTRSPAATPRRRASAGLTSTHPSGARCSRTPTRPVLVRVCQCSTVRPVLRRNGKRSVTASAMGSGETHHSWARPSAVWKHAVLVQPGRAADRRRRRGARPLHAALGVDAVPRHPRVVAQPPGRHPAPLHEGVLRALPPRVQRLPHPQRLPHGQEDVEVGPGQAGRLHRLAHPGHPALGVGVGPVLLAPDGGGQHHVGQGGGGRLEPVLHHQQVEVGQGPLQPAPVGERHRRVGGDDPQPLDGAVVDAVDDVRVGPAPRGRQPLDRPVPQAGDLLPVGGRVPRPVPGHRGRRPRLPGAHGVALAGDGERRRPRLAHVAGDQAQGVEEGDRLGALDRVVDAHRPGRGGRPRPPEGQRRPPDQLAVDPALGRHPLQAVAATWAASSSNPDVWAST